MSAKPLASVSLDLDNQWAYMRTHGDAGWDSYPSYLDVFVPYALDALDDLGLTITFFVVGKDAALDLHREPLGLLAARGHEVGNHSYHHEQWMHTYPRDRIKREIADAAEAIERATGQRPAGFRGPGFTWNGAILDVLAELGYVFDASTFPTYLGPLARLYYFRQSSLGKEEKEQRKNLFGGFGEGRRALKPYLWSLPSGRTLLEIPVTTIPGIKTPFHLSYLLHLSRYSTGLMSAYLDTALALCRLTGTEPSFLLHPLDLLGPEQAPGLAFFPGMDVPAPRKLEVFQRVLRELGRRFQLVPMGEHARRILERPLLVAHPTEMRRMPDARPLVSILAPAFNEADVVQTNLQRVCDYMAALSHRFRWNVVVVDDGSSDGTGELAMAFAAARHDVRVHRHAINLGLGQALRSGFRVCDGDYIVVIDLDLTYSPEHIGALLDRIVATRAEIVLASPYMAGGRTSSVPWIRKLLSRWGNRFLALTARGVNTTGNISTLTGMVRAYDARFIRSLNLKSTGMEINTEIIYKGMILNARIEEVPAHLDWRAQKRTRSIRATSGRIRRGIVFSLLAGFIIRPFAFFIIPAAVLGLVSLYELLWIAYHVSLHYRRLAPGGGGFDALFTESVALEFQQAPHAFVIVGITLVLSVQLLSLGVLALQAKQYFEELFHFETRIYGHSLALERLLAERRAGRDEA